MEGTVPLPSLMYTQEVLLLFLNLYLHILMFLVHFNQIISPEVYWSWFRNIIHCQILLCYSVPQPCFFIIVLKAWHKRMLILDLHTWFYCKSHYACWVLFLASKPYIMQIDDNLHFQIFISQWCSLFSCL